MTDCTQFEKRVRSGKWVQEYKPSAQDGLCPGFWKGCPAAFGCPWHCSYCFLSRPRALRTGKPSGCVLYPVGGRGEDVDIDTLVENSVQLDSMYQKVINAGVEFINWGESADSLACNTETFFLQHIYQNTISRDGAPTSLLLTKSSGEGWLDWVLDQEPTDKLIFSLSVTTGCVERHFERPGGTPDVASRQAAARFLQDAGWRVRLRIDPLAPSILGGKPRLDIGEADVRYLIECLMDTGPLLRGRIGYCFEGPWQLTPELITLGTLRFTGCNAYSKPLIEQFGMGRDAGGRYRLPMEQRVELYEAAVEAIGDRCVVGLCKEPAETHVAVFGEAPDPKEMRCNCTA